MSDLYLSENDHGDWVELMLLGPVNHHTTKTLRTYLRPLAGRHVQLNLTNCTGVDLDGAFALDVLHAETDAKGGSITLAHVPALIAHYLRDHHMGHLLA